MPATWSEHGDVLCVAQQVRRDGCERSQSLKQLEKENSKLKRIAADQDLDITMLRDLVGIKMVSREDKRVAIAHVCSRCMGRASATPAGWWTAAIDATVRSESEAG